MRNIVIYGDSNTAQHSEITAGSLGGDLRPGLDDCGVGPQINTVNAY